MNKKIIVVIIAVIVIAAALIFGYHRGYSPSQLRISKGAGEVHYGSGYTFTYGLQAGMKDDLFLILKNQPNQLPLGHAVSVSNGQEIDFCALRIKVLEVHDDYIVISIDELSQVGP